jgi:aryl-alcohol dehydrogenase-like predicted oxidoreductase/predicted kinase
VTDWLTPSELRIGLGCMRLEDEADATIAAALESGITVFDTARAYDGGEALLADALRDVEGARIVTKGGMSRAGGAWIPDGRAKAIRADCETSLEALNGLPIDLYLLHMPDPRTPLRTSVRALARLVDDGLVARVGVCNVNRVQLDEALVWAPIAAVQVAINPFDDRALRGGVVERCAELRIAVIAHSPLGGPKRAPRLGRHEALAEIAADHGATEAEVALAWLVGLGPEVVAIPGARRPETARSAARAASLRLGDDERDRLGRAHRTLPHRTGGGDVVVVVGVPGAGKSRVAEDYAARGYVRLNRDERGGSLADIADALDDVLESGSREVVLDNTYLKRAARNRIVEAAARHGVPARCIWVDTPLAQAQVNLVERLLDRFGALPAPEELEQVARFEAGLLSATQQMRAFRELEPPAEDEGFATVEHVPFVRASRKGVAGVFVAASVVGSVPVQGADPAAPHLVFDWRPGGDVDELDSARTAVAAVVSGAVEAAICPHPGGPPTCWCRPPLPGLMLAFARRHGLDPASSLVVGASPAHRTLATTLGARYVTA